MQNIKMKLSHPRFVIPGDLSEVDFEFPQCLRKHVQSEISTVSTKRTQGDAKGLLFTFSQVSWFKHAPLYAAKIMHGLCFFANIHRTLLPGY